MSYTVGLLLTSAHSDDAHAFKEFTALVEVTDIEEPHPTFVAVHRELTARFPCICDLPDDQVDDGVWSDGPLINNFGQQQAVLGLMYSTAETVLLFVVKIANKHGITVFDWQIRSIYRPPC